jgi:hypothetical protein
MNEMADNPAWRPILRTFEQRTVEGSDGQKYVNYMYGNPIDIAIQNICVRHRAEAPKLNNDKLEPSQVSFTLHGDGSLSRRLGIVGVPSEIQSASIELIGYNCDFLNPNVQGWPCSVYVYVYEVNLGSSIAIHIASDLLDTITRLHLARRIRSLNIVVRVDMLFSATDQYNQLGARLFVEKDDWSSAAKGFVDDIRFDEVPEPSSNKEKQEETRRRTTFGSKA